MISVDMKTPGSDRALGGSSLLAGKSETVISMLGYISSPTLAEATSFLNRYSRGAAASSLFGVIDEGLRQRLLVLNNLFDFTEADDANRQAQADGAVLVNSSMTATNVDMVCALFGCKLASLAPDDAATSLLDGDEIIFSDDELHWLFDFDDEFIVSLKTSAPQRLAIIEKRFGEADVERVLDRVRDLGDALGDRLEAMRCVSVRGLK